MTHARMPALFVGHGNPLNALEHNEYTEAWHTLAGALPRPKAILAVLAHWYVPGGRVTANEQPDTIHDFGGFPQELFDVQYPAPGAPALAQRTRDLLGPVDVAMDQSWGLDHGTWSVLVHRFPDADVPVVQLGIDETLTAEQHYELATRLQPLRDEDVLILGSGNIVHNLHTYSWTTSSRCSTRWPNAARTTRWRGRWEGSTAGRSRCSPCSSADRPNPLVLRREP